MISIDADMDAFSAEEMTVLDNELQQIKMALIAVRLSSTISIFYYIL